MSRLPQELSARGSLFLYVHSHSQLQYFFSLGETRRAANQRGPLEAAGPARTGKVVEIHPLGGSKAAQRG
jgi:hypothetical protein